MKVPDTLELKTSPVHGLGIFAKEYIPKGSYLGEFEGIYMKHIEFKSKYGNNTKYCYLKRRTWEYRVAKDNRNFITFMNCNRDNPNVILKKWGAYAVCDINLGAELFLNYGKYYPYDF